MNEKLISTNVSKKEHEKREKAMKEKQNKDGFIEVERVDLSKMITTHGLAMKERMKEDVIDIVEEARVEELNKYNEALDKNAKEQKKENENT